MGEGKDKMAGLPYMSPPEMFDGENWVLVKLEHLYGYEEQAQAAVLAEREQAAKIAEEITERQPYKTDSRVACRQIAAAIRNQPEGSGAPT